MTRAALTVALSIATLAGTPGVRAQPASPADEQRVAPASEDQCDNAALLYYHSWLVARDLLTNELVHDVSRPDPDWHPSDQQTDLVEAHQDDIGRLLEAASIERVDWGVDYARGIDISLPHLGMINATGRVLTIDARRLIDLGEIDQAALRVAALYRMSRHTTHDPLLISSLVGEGMVRRARVEVGVLVASGGLTREARDTVLGAMDTLDPDDPFGVRRAILGERDIFLQWISDQYNGPDAGADFVREMLPKLEGIPSEPNENSRALSRMDGDELRADFVKAERFYDDILDSWDRPDEGEQTRRIIAGIENGRYGIVGHYVLPAMSKIRDSDDRTVVALAEARKLLLEAHVAEGAGG